MASSAAVKARCGAATALATGSGREIVALELDFDLVTRVRERGWNGLGQVLKSFRDRPNVYPPYGGGARSQALDALGPLVKPAARS